MPHDLTPREGADTSSLSLRLDLLADRAAGLAALAYRYSSILQVLAGGPAGSKQAFSLPDLRATLHEFNNSVGQIRNADKNLLLDADPAISDVIATGFSRDNERRIGTFLELAKTACDELHQKRPPSPLAVQELVRLTCCDLAAVLDDITSAVRSARAMAAAIAMDLAVTDELTGLPNRRALTELSKRLVTERLSDADEHQITAMHIDLDKFKQINDTMGHAAGDEALRHAAKVLKSHARPEDFVARVGGDEFVLLFMSAIPEDMLNLRANKLIEDISQAFLFQGKECCIGASIGIAVGPMGSHDDFSRLLTNADLALYASKNAGRGRHQLFTPALRSRHQEIEEMVEQIQQGLADNQFEPYFQPQVEGRSGKLVGLESLVRWNHPDRGLLMPFSFLDIAEDAGLLDSLDVSLNRKVFQSARKWLDQGLDVPQVSINMSASRLLEPDLVEQLSFDLEREGIAPEMIGVEILESAMIEATSKQMIDNITRLGESGFRVELDDFGTGHASISNLRNFRVDRIKIDRSFVKDVHLYPELSKITSAMIGLAHSLRIDALAEGVETPEERLVLNALGCDHIQGFGVSKPMPSSKVSDWIRRTQRKRTLPERRLNVG